MGLNVLRGDSSGTILATGRPYRIIVNATRFFSTSETTLEKCVFASFTFNVVGTQPSFLDFTDSLPNLGLLVNPGHYGISTVTLKKRWRELVGYCHSPPFSNVSLPQTL